MLQDQKKMYMQVADTIPNWRAQTNSDLIRKYCEAKKTEDKQTANCYAAAIIVRYWGVITNYYRQPHSERVYVEDCYDWLINAFMNVTNHSYWFEDPVLKLTYVKTGEVRTRKNPIFGKSDAPEITLKKCITSMRLGFFQDANRDIRKLNYTAASVDKMVDDKQVGLLPHHRGIFETTESVYVNNILADTFKYKFYTDAFVLDGIVNGNVFEYNKEDKTQTLSKKKLVKHLRNLDDNYCTIIADELKLDKFEIIKASQPFRKYGSKRLYNIIDKSLSNLKVKLAQKLKSA